MSERIITLFGEEIIPEQSKKGGKKKSVDKAESTAEATPRIPDLPQQPPAAPAAMLFEVPVAPSEVAGGEKLNAPNVQDEGSSATNVQEEPEVTQIEGPTDADAGNSKALEETEPEEQTEVPVFELQKSPEETPQEMVLAEAEEEIEPATEIAGQVPAAPTAGTLELPTDGKKYYTIGEVSEIFNLKTSNIRFWTNEFKIKVRTTRKGDRLYTPEQVKELKAIYHLVKDRGFTLAGAKDKLKEQKNMDVTTIDLKQSLMALKEKLVSIKNQIK